MTKSQHIIWYLVCWDFVRWDLFLPPMIGEERPSILPTVGWLHHPWAQVILILVVILTAIIIVVVISIRRKTTEVRNADDNDQMENCKGADEQTGSKRLLEATQLRKMNIPGR